MFSFTSMNTKNIFIISGPAGSGKDTIIEHLETSLPLERIITTTTREARPGESEGHPYYFISQTAFEQGIQNDDFAEYSTNENGVLYGVSKAELRRISELEHRIGIWKIDWKGVESAKKLFPAIQAIFISAPLAVLEERLRSRDNLKDERYFTERMAYTREWLKHTDIYDYVVENEQDKLDQAIEDVKTIILTCAPLASL